ncbi:MAG TPA: Wzz/FepE/Etk N-terminal domain-containing protein, partial [Thermoleophilia bacterium]|nr:Wzz/FepE/Etk N-terminal domain-containing protein [Thermoleophilia bacterium]
MEPERANLTLRDAFAIVWRRKWLLILMIAGCTAAAFIFSASQPRQYVSSTKLMYERQLDVANPLTGTTYTDPNERNLELNSVGEALQSPEVQRLAGEKANGLPPEDSFTITVTPISTGQNYSNVVEISVQSRNPELSAKLANGFATGFIEWRKQQERQQIMRAIKVLDQKIKAYGAAATNVPDFIQLQQRLHDLEILHATVTGNYTVITPAVPDPDPVSPQPLRSAALGFAVGLFAAIGLAFLLEQLDTRVRTVHDVSASLELPVLGRIPQVPERQLRRGSIIAAHDPDGTTAEALRVLRTNLEFVGVDGDIKSLMITSCSQGDGKTLTVCNLAFTLAMAGNRVIVVDGDLRRPRVHAYFNLSNDIGLSTVLAGKTSLIDTMQPYETYASSDNGANGKQAATGSRLLVLTSGPKPPNPGEMIASRRLDT